ncbi:hypothetical protein [Lentilactobacillus kefiri]|uniref:hypothetical protein n=1 Tax=Lentilactobacillus kefiri TaxID=33962 RepID=UPI00345E2704
MDITLAIIWIILTAAIFVIVIGAFYLIYKNAVAKPPRSNGATFSLPWQFSV